MRTHSLHSPALGPHPWSALLKWRLVLPRRRQQVSLPGSRLKLLSASVLRSGRVAPSRLELEQCWGEPAGAPATLPRKTVMCCRASRARPSALAPGSLVKQPAPLRMSMSMQSEAYRNLPTKAAPVIPQSSTASYRSHRLPKIRP